MLKNNEELKNKILDIFKDLDEIEIEIGEYDKDKNSVDFCATFSEIGRLKMDHLAKLEKLFQTKESLWAVRILEKHRIKLKFTFYNIA